MCVGVIAPRFGNCGNVENAKFGHTWYEGIQSCKGRQFQMGVGEQLHAVQARGNASSDNNSTGVHSKAIIMAPRVFVSSANTSTLMSSTSSIAMPANALIIIVDRQNLANSVGATTSKSINVTISTIVRTAVNALKPKQSLPLVNGTVVRSMMHSASAGISTTTLSHAADRSSMITRKYIPSKKII